MGRPLPGSAEPPRAARCDLRGAGAELGRCQEGTLTVLLRRPQRVLRPSDALPTRKPSRKSSDLQMDTSIDIVMMGMPKASR